ncbi:MAG TPA: sulfotransferase domain-containing protein [Candidatus Binatia bacterium]|jgi:hypothetical protein
MKILVVGIARSGTSFLGEIFGQNPTMAYLYEPFWGNTIIKQKQFLWLTEGDDQPDSERLLREVFNGRFDELERQQPQPRNHNFTSRREEVTRYLRGRSITNSTDVVVKEIRLNIQLRWVVKVMGSDLRIVHLIRDPRGVVASFLLPMKERANRSGVEQVLRLSSIFSRTTAANTMYSDWGWNRAPELQRFAPEFQDYGRLLDTGSPHQRVAARWALMTGHAISDTAKIPARQYYRVRYEDLCRDPVGVCGRIYEFLGKAVPQGVTDWLLKNTQGGNRENRYRTSRDSLEMIDVWKSQLTKEQVRHIESLCRPLMETLGYL